MVTVATQTAIGEVGSKASTYLRHSFSSMVNAGKFQCGSNDNGIYILNYGYTDEGVPFTRSFTTFPTDFGIPNLKRLRVLFVGCKADDSFVVSVMGDNKEWRDYSVNLVKVGQQELSVHVGRDGYGRYWKMRISSTKWFKIDTVSGVVIVRSTGHRG